ncbi:MAG: hypothetical protein A2498_14605 [Lentisphaerae bacterium RIFOXYC12_FULL_60_16]|nr:MAG: hypothetical protein A2498_14605 [Lentisphaerae bacterium RIFOXYC12_FULL_60_16]
MAFNVHQWIRNPANPVLKPGPEPFDVSCCMNPFVLQQGDEYWLYYAGGDAQGARRICLAIAPVSDVTRWKKLGPRFDIGKPDDYDGAWCVLPCVHRIGNRWHLYFSTRSNDADAGLQSFRGIGLATSDDLLHWTKRPGGPVLLGDGFPEWPDNKGIAGGARIIDLPQPDGRILHRMYYTLATGTPHKDILIDQAKQAVIAHSYDGITWFDRRVVMRPRPEAAYENAAVIALNIWKTRTRWRAIYAGIGTQYGYYSICEAVSQDGLTWERGNPGENLTLPPAGDGWEKQMTEYPNVIREGAKIRLFYCGNGYGTTGIGTALADPLD